jgi:uncharacterized protein YicC (UPF0701 family)
MVTDDLSALTVYAQALREMRKVEGVVVSAEAVSRLAQLRRRVAAAAEKVPTVIEWGL